MSSLYTRALSLVALAALTGCAALSTRSGSAAVCPERLLVLATENDDVFVLPAPTDLCSLGADDDVSERRVAEITDSLLVAANLPPTTSRTTKSSKAGFASLQNLAGCCRVRVRWRVVARPPEVTVRGTRVNVESPSITVGVPEVRGEGFPEVRIGRDSNSPDAGAVCRHMTSAAYIPAGHHPVSVNWMPGDPRGDLVCTSRSDEAETQFVPWLDVPMPSGYTILYQFPNPSTSFNGCKRWSVWQGQAACIDMYPRYRLQKNSV